VSRTDRGVDCLQLIENDPARPCIHYDVMGCQNENMLGRGDSQNRDPKQGADFEAEWRPADFLHALRDLITGPGLGFDLLKADLLVLGNDEDWFSVSLGESSTKLTVPICYYLNRLVKRTNVQRRSYPGHELQIIT
jgi:hypothetical protein